MLDEIFFVPFILFFNLLSEIRNKAKGREFNKQVQNYLILS